LAGLVARLRCSLGDMPKYVIERGIPGIAKATPEEAFRLGGIFKKQGRAFMKRLTVQMRLVSLLGLFVFLSSAAHAQITPSADSYTNTVDPTGSYNTASGDGALTGNTTGNDLTCIGYSCNTAADGLTNSTAIGAHAVVGQSNALVLGGTGPYAVKVGIGTAPPSNVLTIAQGAGHPVSDSWETYSSRRWKTNIHLLENALRKVEQLRGVSDDLKDSGKHEIGVIAEEVGAVVPELVSYEANGKDARSVDYARLTA